MKSLIASLLAGCSFLLGASNNAEEKFVQPETPVILSAGLSPKVQNGTVFESGSAQVTDGATLILPESAVVEEYSGSSVRFFLTKSMHCVGHPSVPMQITDARNHFGIAFQEVDGELVISTFGEWSNHGGHASIRLLVLVPMGQKFELRAGLDGGESAASTTVNFDDPALKNCYWYSGVEPRKDWKEIKTDLNYNRFLATQ